ncbi:FES (predicted) [Pycnogonum litorale]
MGFASSLQGQESHEALVLLQDAEVRLLENMKRCVIQRIKCDREYAVSLNSVYIQAQKIEKSDDLSDSIVALTWRIMMEETEALSRLMKQNADYLAIHTLDKLTNLISEKRASRKFYLEEHIRITNELSQMQAVVSKTKTEYEKYMDLYKVCKAKYEEHYLRGKPGKKFDEIKEKYVRSCRKLHFLHNEYILMLCEANEYERHFRNFLLPGLLQYQEVILQEMINDWKKVLEEYVKFTDMSSDKFVQCQRRIYCAVNDVEATDEYSGFVKNHQTSPIEQRDFTYDFSLLVDFPGNLKPNELTVDDSTFDNLKLKKQSCESQLSDCRLVLKEKDSLLIQYENELTAIRKSPETATTLAVKKRAIDILKRSITELKCQEERFLTLKSLLERSLLSIGTEPPPPALQLEDGVFCSNEQLDCTGGNDTVGRSKSKLIKEMLRNPFYKKQGQFGNSSPPLPPVKDFIKNSPRLSTPTRFTNENQNVSGVMTECYSLSSYPDRPLADEEWFHGVLPREEVVRLLCNEGDFLVRQTTRNEEQQIVLSVCWKGHKHFIVQMTSEGLYRFEGPAFPSIQELVAHQHQSSSAVTNKSGVILKTPVLRERWELNNNDVELISKIGRGNFGDVYRAKLHPSDIEVAVKTCKVTLPDEQKKKFLQEGRILKQYNHPNIVKFIGICVQKQPIMIVMELVPGGSLLRFLRASGPTLSQQHLLQMCIDATRGMEYLESKNCIHRDLAARNCLVGLNNMVKISDFGMSREEEEYIVSDGMKQIPIKWTAPEALNYGKYTCLCDVWSYGVLMWEIYSGGSSPYSGLSNGKAREMIDSGYRLPAPENTPPSVYNAMLKCWEYDPEKRPHFAEVCTMLENVDLFASSASPDT